MLLWKVISTERYCEALKGSTGSEPIGTRVPAATLRAAHQTEDGTPLGLYGQWQGIAKAHRIWNT